jgi:hypothetical protein
MQKKVIQTDLGLVQDFENDANLKLLELAGDLGPTNKTLLITRIDGKLSKILMKYYKLKNNSKIQRINRKMELKPIFKKQLKQTVEKA